MSMKEVLLILLVISTGAISGEANCGRLIETELYNDKSYTEQEEHPWLGRILYRDVNGSSSYRCTVVLLNSRHVLAPALCVKGKYIREQTPFAVMFGNPVCLSGKTSPRSFEIDEVFVPPEYNQTSYKYDLAVIRLMEHVLFSKHIQPICLPQSEEILSSLAGRSSINKYRLIKFAVTSMGLPYNPEHSLPEFEW
ncbi:ovochymase-2-like [Drosophila eugracilis]|uniref:ovochymase-2-like n=1 Tax=Drosophila eugracilis TaxID=29029 RepID=UPI001BDAE872|nr:ovochymase-2-like [Drosophila eugracilis]